MGVKRNIEVTEVKECCNSVDDRNTVIVGAGNPRESRSQQYRSQLNSALAHVFTRITC